MDSKKEIESLKKLLDEACNNYYNEGRMIMSDIKFDKLKKEYEALSGEIYSTETKPSKRMVSVEHTFENLVGTYQKAQTLKEAFEFIDSIPRDVFSIRISYKYDGNSISIEYDNGKIVKALTRGADGKGADLTDLFKNKSLPITDHMAIRYEAMLTYKNFEEVKKLKNKEYANPRSMVAGILSDKEGIKYSKYITLVPLSCIIKDRSIDKLKEAKLLKKLIGEQNINYTYVIESGYKDQLKEKLEDFYNSTILQRNNLNYMIDGLVIEVINKDIVSELGYVGTAPKFAIALKFPYMEDETTIKEIQFDISEYGSGRITPVAIYEPVYFNGAEMNRTSLANYKRYTELKPIGKGTKILVQYRNDVLSYVEKLDVESNTNIEHQEFIKKCPICNGDVIINEEKTFAYCNNPECKSKKIGKINNFCNKVGMKGIEYKTLEVIYNEGKINDFNDLYKLTVDDIKNIEGLGEKSATNIINIIKNTEIKDYLAITGLGISNIGEDKAKLVLTEYSFDDIINLDIIKNDNFIENLIKIEGISNILANKIKDGLIEYNESLIKLNNTIEIVKVKRKKASKKLTFVATGETIHFKDRYELKAFIEEHGHKLTGSVSGKTDYLVTNDTTTGTVKNREAQKRGIPIITDKEVVDIILDLEKED